MTARKKKGRKQRLYTPSMRKESMATEEREETNTEADHK
jgi:hypothetical protein